jgi:putative phosphoesterase
MRILIIADIHANPWALLAVLRNANPVDYVLCAGDTVNYGPEPRRVIAQLRALDAVVVRGNHDHAVAFAADPRASAAKLPLAIAMRDWTREQLEPSELAWLKRLPLELRWEIVGTTFSLCHATPRDALYDYRLVPTASDELVINLVGNAQTDVLVVGHTHLPFVRKLKHTTIVNPGSVGQPLDGDPRAAFGLWEDGHITLRRAAYDVEAAVSEFRRSWLKAAWVDTLVHILRNGQIG